MAILSPNATCKCHKTCDPSVLAAHLMTPLDLYGLGLPPLLVLVSCEPHDNLVEHCEVELRACLHDSGDLQSVCFAMVKRLQVDFDEVSDMNIATYPYTVRLAGGVRRVQDIPCRTNGSFAAHQSQARGKAPYAQSARSVREDAENAVSDDGDVVGVAQNPGTSERRCRQVPSDKRVQG